MHISSAKIGRLSLAAVLGAVAFQSFAGISLADGRRDYYIQEAEKLFYGTTTNAAQAGVAGATNVTSSDSSAVVNNPAGIGLNQGGDLSLTYGRNEISGNQDSDYAEVEDESDTGQVLVSIPLDPTLDGSPNAGSLGFGWTGVSSESDDSVNTEGENNQVHGAYGIEISDGLSVGYGLTWFDNKQETDVSNFEQTDGFRHNFGVQNVDGDLKTGFNFFFADGEYELDYANDSGTSDYSQHGFEVGAAYRLSDVTTVATAFDYQSFDVDGDFLTGPTDTFIGGNEGGTFFAFKAGLEQALSEMFTARVGYKYLGKDNYFFGREDIRDFNGSSKSNAYTAGLGVTIPTGSHYFPSVKLDYAAEYREIAYGDWQQTVTLSFPFTLCEVS